MLSLPSFLTCSFSYIFAALGALIYRFTKKNVKWLRRRDQRRWWREVEKIDLIIMIIILTILLPWKKSCFLFTCQPSLSINRHNIAPTLPNHLTLIPHRSLPDKSTLYTCFVTLITGLTILSPQSPWSPSITTSSFIGTITFCIHRYLPPVSHSLCSPDAAGLVLVGENRQSRPAWPNSKFHNISQVRNKLSAEYDTNYQRILKCTIISLNNNPKHAPRTSQSRQDVSGYIFIHFS